MSVKHLPHEYKAIEYWGQMLGSMSYYIKTEQSRASRANAPLDAIYERDGVWRTINECAECTGHKESFARWMHQNYGSK